MLRIPQRTSLVAQTRASLLDYLAQHQPGEPLPSERQLCDLLKVSRVTLRSALAQLQREGLVTGGPGRARVIQARRRHSGTGVRSVVVLAPERLHQLEPRALFMFDELRQQLEAGELHLEFVCQPTLYAASPDAVLEQLRARLKPACWVLYRSTRAMQEWMANEGRPAVVIGSPHAGVQLPAVQADYRATNRHAAQRLLARGHRAIALLLPAVMLAGIMESEEGFREAAAPGLEILVGHHDGSPAGVQRALATLLKRRPRPTGFVVARPAHALTVLGHLLHCGLRVPQDAAVIALEHDWFLDHTVPRITCYFVDPVVFARRLCRQVLAVAGGGETGHRTERIMPRFLPGETVG
jgi:DNA-binding LacI/PurR family transcriptional regulator